LEAGSVDQPRIYSLGSINADFQCRADEPLQAAKPIRPSVRASGWRHDPLAAQARLKHALAGRVEIVAIDKGDRRALFFVLELTRRRRVCGGRKETE
jgi:hypothetical protein